MESELNREILCADEICWVVSFIKTSGVNLLWDSLKKFSAEGKRLRIITTTYTGATDYDAIARLATLPNTEIKISELSFKKKNTVSCLITPHPISQKTQNIVFCL